MTSHGRGPFLILSALLVLGSVGAADAQDVAAGEKVFAQCRACHQVGPSARNVVGPVLNGLFGRKAGTVEGYSYSAANKGSGTTWTEDAFRDYIRDPKAAIPGTKMAFAGIKNEQQVTDLVAFLKQFDTTGNKPAN